MLSGKFKKFVEVFQVVSGGFMRSQEFHERFRGFQGGISGGFRGVSKDLKGFQGILEKFSGFKGVSRGLRGFSEFQRV